MGTEQWLVHGHRAVGGTWAFDFKVCLHGVSFARAGLAIREDANIVPVPSKICHGRCKSNGSKYAVTHLVLKSRVVGIPRKPLLVLKLARTRDRT